MRFLYNTVLALALMGVVFGTASCEQEGGKHAKSKGVKVSPSGDLKGVWRGNLKLLRNDKVENCRVDLSLEQDDDYIPSYLVWGRVKARCESVVLELNANEFLESEGTKLYNNEIIDVYDLYLAGENQGWVSQDYKIINLDYHSFDGSTRLLFNAETDSRKRFQVNEFTYIQDSIVQLSLARTGYLSYQGKPRK